MPWASAKRPTAIKLAHVRNASRRERTGSQRDPGPPQANRKTPFIILPADQHFPHFLRAALWPHISRPRKYHLEQPIFASAKMNEGVFIPGRYLPTGDGYLTESIVGV